MCLILIFYFSVSFILNMLRLSQKGIDSVVDIQWRIVFGTLKTTKEDKGRSQYAERQALLGRRIGWTRFDNDW